ncbi:ABC transporter substrate-binding protein [Puniceibacterium sp. IMCC21224]|uniref:ABC transporter substrate-binding protein n=1 Tax=Puniceibacterium sp. IMCC21224 TaxID=1618204 RepID=UPI00064DBF0F|nr:ABC transporter substrate-binding protein [Puniceibacterium sp. IMCC21224]KMK65485.1 ABC-type nitrate/sulfonate/bicarbonate transport system, periplasmic component [Puniceibacterium sp. IMCC21224]
MKSFKYALGLVASLSMAGAALAQDVPVIRAAVLKIGTVNWELETITANGFDAKYGFALDVQPFADNGATRVAVEGGEADVAVADWIWVARQRAEGKDYVFVPYSKAVGSVVVPNASTAESLKDLAGGKIGIAGGPLDKSWLILRAYAQQEYGMDLKAETEQVYGAPPLIFKAGLSGELDGAINFWHFLAKMKAGGMRELISVETAATALGLNPDTPLLGYYMKESFITEHPGIAQALYDASQDSKALMASDPAVWDALRPMMNASTDAQFETLKADYVAGSPSRGPVDLDGADKFLKLMADLGGAELVGKATTLPVGLFADVK